MRIYEFTKKEKEKEPLVLTAPDVFLQMTNV